MKMLLAMAAVIVLAIPTAAQAQSVGDRFSMPLPGGGSLNGTITGGGDMPGGGFATFQFDTFVAVNGHTTLVHILLGYYAGSMSHSFTYNDGETWFSVTGTNQGWFFSDGNSEGWSVRREWGSPGGLIGEMGSRPLPRIVAPDFGNRY